MKRMLKRMGKAVKSSHWSLGQVRSLILGFAAAVLADGIFNNGFRDLISSNLTYEDWANFSQVIIKSMLSAFLVMIIAASKSDKQAATDVKAQETMDATIKKSNAQ